MKWSANEVRILMTILCCMLLNPGILATGQVEPASAKGDGWRLEDGVLLILQDNGAEAYRKCRPEDVVLERLVIGEAVSELGSADMRAKKIEIAPGNDTYSVCNGILLEQNGKRCVLAQWPLEAAKVPDGVMEIGDHAFFGQTSLRSVTFPNSLKRIGFSAFEDCVALQQIVFPESLEEVAGFAFWGCTALERVDMSQTNIKSLIDTFGLCENLREVLLPNTLIRLGDSTFYQCKELSLLRLPDSLKELEGGALFGCLSLTALRIPADTRIILAYEDSFEGWPTLFGGTGVRTVVFAGSAPQIPIGTFAAYIDGTRRLDAVVERIIFMDKPPAGDSLAAINVRSIAPQIYYLDTYAEQWRESTAVLSHGLQIKQITCAQINQMLSEDGMQRTSVLPEHAESDMAPANPELASPLVKTDFTSSTKPPNISNNGKIILFFAVPVVLIIIALVLFVVSQKRKNITKSQDGNAI